MSGRGSEPVVLLVPGHRNERHGDRLGRVEGPVAPDARTWSSRSCAISWRCCCVRSLVPGTPRPIGWRWRRWRGCTMIDDLILDGQVVIPPRPGPVPGRGDAEVITIVLVRHLLHRRSESGFLAEITRDHPGLFPRLPHHSEFNRRARWLWGAFEQTRQVLADQLPADDWGQVDTSALPVKHPSRMRGPDSWTGPNGLAARFGAGRRPRRVVLRVPPGSPHRPGLTGGPGVGDRASSGQ
jgi:hypothetical protein